MPRISWSPDGRRLLVCDHGALRIVATDSGATVCELAPRTIQLGPYPRDGEPGSQAIATFFDGHWLRDGRIAAIDIFGMRVSFSMRGEPYGEPASRPNPWRIDFAALSGDGQELVRFHPNNRLIVTTGADDRHRWELTERGRWYGMGSGRYAVATLSYDGMALAVGCAFDHYTAAGEVIAGDHGWLALDLTEGSGSRQVPILGRGLDRATALIFDRSAKRLLLATVTDASVIRLGAEYVPAASGLRRTLSEAKAAMTADSAPPSCAALDDRGIRAVYAFAARTELRIDYLSPKRAGPLTVEVLDRQHIDAGLAPVALALDPEGNRIACLAEDGRVEIVPVP